MDNIEEPGDHGNILSDLKICDDKKFGDLVDQNDKWGDREEDFEPVFHRFFAITSWHRSQRVG